MEKRILILLFTSYVNCQFDVPIKPERCYGTTELLNRQCCVFPPFFKREIAKMCGAKFSVLFIDNNANVTGLRREANNPCEHWTCVLTKYGLLTPEEKLDDDKYFTHLDKWVNLNPEFSNVMLNAKKHCRQLYRLFLPLRACEFRNLQSCIRNYINVIIGYNCRQNYSTDLNAVFTDGMSMAQFKYCCIFLCFAMTINKSQGQTLRTVGIDLRIPCFPHGQLYVACSRSCPKQISSVECDELNAFYEECREYYINK